MSQKKNFFQLLHCIQTVRIFENIGYTFIFLDILLKSFCEHLDTTNILSTVYT